MAEDEAEVAVEGILTPTGAVMEPEEDRAYGEHEDGTEVEVDEEIEVAVPEVPEEDRAHGEHEEDEAEAAVVRTAAATCCREEMSRPLRTRRRLTGKEKWLRMTVPRRQKRSNSWNWHHLLPLILLLLLLRLLLLPRLSQPQFRLRLHRVG
jgi:hypothetical protein